MSNNIDSNVWTGRYSECYGTDEYLQRIEEDSLLIKELGAMASAFHPGISITTPGEGRMQLDAASWNWLRPLLVELANIRKSLLRVSEEDE